MKPQQINLSQEDSPTPALLEEVTGDGPPNSSINLVSLPLTRAHAAVWLGPQPALPLMEAQGSGWLEQPTPCGSHRKPGLGLCWVTLGSPPGKRASCS